VVNANDDALNQALSAVMDGRATPADWARVQSAWDRDPELRERWALWHAAGDGLRSAELPPLHRESQTLLDALHAQMPPTVATHPRWREWLAPAGVAASFIALALGIGALRPPAPDEPALAAAPMATPRAQGLSGLSFAQTAAGRTLPALGASREAGTTDAPPEVIDWSLTLPEPAASSTRP
jgi:negative regulator of sigma E activity